MPRKKQNHTMNLKWAREPMSRSNGDPTARETLADSNNELNEMLLNAARDGDALLLGMEALLLRGADVNYEDYVTVAAENGHLEAVALLVAWEASLDSPDTDGVTALWKAAANGHIQVVSLLLEQGAKYGTVLHRAAEGGHLEVVRLLLDRGAAVDARCTKKYDTALNRAAEGGHLEVVRLLLDRGAVVDAVNGRGTALHMAAEGGHLEVVTLLLDRGAPVLGAPNWVDGTSLHRAARGGHLEVVRLLLDRGAAVDTRDVRTALYYAAEGGHLEVVRLLLDRGAAVDAADWNVRRTALHCAAEAGHLEVVTLLLRDVATGTHRTHLAYSPKSELGQSRIWVFIIRPLTPLFSF